MPDVTIYSTAICPYCVEAKNYLTHKGVGYEEVRIDLDPAQRAKMLEMAKRTSVPQIFVGDTHVGGYDDLVRLDREGAVADNRLQLVQPARHDPDRQDRLIGRLHVVAEVGQQEGGVGRDQDAAILGRAEPGQVPYVGRAGDQQRLRSGGGGALAEAGQYVAGVGGVRAAHEALA